MRGAWLSIVLAFSSCGGEPEPSRPVPVATDVTTAVPTTTTAPPPSAPPTSIAPSAPPTLTFVATPSHTGVALSIANHGSVGASLSAHVIVEVEHAGTFAAAPATSALTLRYDCAHEADACVTLAPGAELLPPEWLGTSGDMQCACERCVPVEPGSYRLVVTSCDGAHRVESNTFALPAP